MVYYSSLDPSKEFRESFACVQTSCKVFDCTKYIFIQVNHIVRFVLQGKWHPSSIYNDQEREQEHTCNTDTTLANSRTN
jgi:hypothetical protein